MSRAPLNRREFLRLSLLLTGSAVASACEPTRSALTPTVAPTLALPSWIKLTGGNTDAWTLHKPVRGSMSNPAACETMWLDNNQERVEAMGCWRNQGGTG